MTAAASYRILTNSGSSSENSSSCPASYPIPRTISAVSNSHRNKVPVTQIRVKVDKKKKADWENQHENLALIDYWKTHFRALKKARSKTRISRISRIFVSPTFINPSFRYSPIVNIENLDFKNPIFSNIRLFDIHL